MLTPAMVVEMWKSSRVICRAQPPFWMRLGARLNEAQNCGMPLTSVAGGLRKLGSWPASPGSCGPGSVNALGLVTLTAPSGGRSGLPKPLAARAAAVRAADPPAANIARRERFALIISLVISTHGSTGCFGVSFMTWTINSILSHNPQKFGRLALIQRVTLHSPRPLSPFPPILTPKTGFGLLNPFHD